MPLGDEGKSLIVALDFDGVVVTNRFPEIGQDLGCATYIRFCQREYDMRVILWTVRADNRRLGPIGVPLNPDIEENLRGDFLTPAIKECEHQGIKLWSVNLNPEQVFWSPSPKVYADIYIDDKSLGCPLLAIKNEEPCVNWNILGPKLCHLCYTAAYPKTKTGIDPANMAQ